LDQLYYSLDQKSSSNEQIQAKMEDNAFMELEKGGSAQVELIDRVEDGASQRVTVFGGFEL